MRHGASGPKRSNSLISDYSVVLSEAVLRNKTRTAEHAARIEAEVASRVKSEFISNMSHELRTPLNTVIGFSKILSEHQNRKLKDPEIIEYASLIKDSAVHLLSVINDILDISKLQSGSYRLDAREIDLDEELQGWLTGFGNMSREAKVEIDDQYNAASHRVRGEPGKLKQAICNLIGNAIKFTRAGGSVKVETSTGPRREVVVTIRDTGVGMSEDEIRVALTPFGQVDGSRSRWREGTGLGLPIAKSLIELHGGELAITSVRNEGTVVTVSLPACSELSIVEGRAALYGHGR